jgi:hypothetical protein
MAEKNIGVLTLTLKPSLLFSTLNIGLLNETGTVGALALIIKETTEGL